MYDWCYTPTWGSFIYWTVCKHWAKYTSHPNSSANASWTPLLFISPIQFCTCIKCNPIIYSWRFLPIDIRFNLTTSTWMTTNHILFYTTSFHTIFHQLVSLTIIWSYWGSTSCILEYSWSKHIPLTQPNEPEFADFRLSNEELGPF